MADQTARIDSNSRASLTGVTDDGNAEIKRVLVDPTTRRLKVAATIVSDLEDLADVTITNPMDGEVLTYDNGEWVNAAGGGSLALDDLTDVTISAPSDGEVLTYDSDTGDWINAPSAGSPTGQIMLTAAGAWLPVTSGASGITQVEAGTNDVNYMVIDFADAAVTYAEWAAPIPSNYDGGTITAQFYWLADSASTNSVVWGIQARAYADGDAIDQAYGTAVEVTDANNAQNDVNISDATAAVTIAGTPTASQYVQWRVFRDGNDMADDLAATARLLSVRITYTTS